MQQLEIESNVRVSAFGCSDQLIEVAPLIMRRIRSEMRRHTMPGLSVAQFRTLIYLQRHSDASLSEVAEFLGLSMPSASKLVDRLVMDKSVSRRVAQDRRRVKLCLTERGRTALEMTRLEAREQLSESLQLLSQEELATVSAALRVLGLAFTRGSADVNLPQVILPGFRI